MNDEEGKERKTGERERHEDKRGANEKNVEGRRNYKEKKKIWKKKWREQMQEKEIEKKIERG